MKIISQKHLVFTVTIYFGLRSLFYDHSPRLFCSGYHAADSWIFLRRRSSLFLYLHHVVCREKGYQSGQNRNCERKSGKRFSRCGNSRRRTVYFRSDSLLLPAGCRRNSRGYFQFNQILSDDVRKLSDNLFLRSRVPVRNRNRVWNYDGSLHGFSRDRLSCRIQKHPAD